MLFYSPRMIVAFALISALNGGFHGRTRYQRTAPLRRRTRRNITARDMLRRFTAQVVNAGF